MAQSAMTERCYRSALWGSLRESQLPQHLTVALARHLPSRGGFAPLRGRVDGDIDPYNLCSLALKHHNLWPQKKT